VATFEQLVTEAHAATFSGWDFSWLAARSTTEPLPWSYRAEVARYAADASAMLDMGTGGGEWLSELAPAQAARSPPKRGRPTSRSPRAG
jgi:hypothetical protein